MITLNSKYKPLFENDTRYFIITGGRGSSKSFGVGTFVNLLSFEANHKILFTRQTMTSAHLSIIPEFQEKIDLMELNPLFEVNKSEIKNIQSKSEIIFRGIKTSSGDQTANLKSLQGVTTWILDEAEELTDETTFDKINLSIRQKGKQNRIILILNPATKEHWIYKRFFEDKGVPDGFNGIKDDTTYIHTTYLDNIDNLDSSFINEVERLQTSNPNKYKHQILGGWLSKAEGVVYSNWVIDKFIDTNFGCYGQDFGFSIDPTTLIQISIDKDKKKIYAKECLYKPQLTTTEIYNENIRHVAKNALIVADSAEPLTINKLRNGWSRDELPSNYADLYPQLLQGFYILPAHKGPGSIQSGIDRVKQYECYLTDDSSDWWNEYVNYTWARDKNGNATDTPMDDFNHLFDAHRYVILAKGKYY